MYFEQLDLSCARPDNKGTQTKFCLLIKKGGNMFKKSLSLFVLLAALFFSINSFAATACSPDTEKDGKTACSANEACYLVEGICIEKKSLPEGKPCKKSGVCANMCVKDDGTETKSDGSETGKCN